MLAASPVAALQQAVPRIGFNNAAQIARDQIARCADQSEVKRLVASLAAEALQSPSWCGRCGAFEPLRDAVRDAMTREALVAALGAIDSAFRSNKAVWKAVNREFVVTLFLAKQVLLGVAERSAKATASDGAKVESAWGPEVDRGLDRLIEVFDAAHRAAATNDETELKRMIYSERIWFESLNSRGMTMIMCAAARGSAACVRALLQHGADADAVVSGSKTDAGLRGLNALAFAYRGKHIVVVDILAAHARSRGPLPKKRAQLAAALAAETATREAAAAAEEAEVARRDGPLQTLICPSSRLALVATSTLLGPVASTLLHFFTSLHRYAALFPCLVVLLMLLLELGNCALEREALQRHYKARDVAMSELEARLAREAAAVQQRRARRILTQERADQAADLRRRRKM